MRFDVSLPRDHFDLELCASSGQVFRWAPQPDGNWLGVDGEHWYHVCFAQTTESQAARNLTHATGMNRDARRDALNLQDTGKTESPDQTLTVETNADEAAFRHLFRLDWDADEFRAEILRRGPEIAPYLGAFEGLRLMRPSDPVETFFSFLCTANNNLPRIFTMVGALASYGPPLATVQGQTLHRFPEAETIAEIPEAELRARKFGYRGATIPKAAQELAQRGGRPYLESLKQAPYEEAHEALLSIPGIGPKLADCIALFALHHAESVPIDTHLWHAVTRLYFPEWQSSAITHLKYKTASTHVRTRFGNLSGLVQQHLFFDSVMNWRSRK